MELDNVNYISILLPISSTKYLKETFLSIMHQDYDLRKIEIIMVTRKQLVNEVSSLFSIYLKHHNYKLIEAKKHDIVSALNIGLNKCSFEYVARIDHDDIMLPNRLYNQVKFLNENKNVSAVGGQLELIDKNGDFIGMAYYPITKCEISMSHKYINPLAHPAVMFKKSEVLKVGGYQENYPEDWDLWVRLLSKGRIANLPTPVIQYRVHSEQLSRSELYSNYNALTNMNKRESVRRTERFVKSQKFEFKLIYLRALNTFWNFSRLLVCKVLFMKYQWGKRHVR